MTNPTGDALKAYATDNRQALKTALRESLVRYNATPIADPDLEAWELANRVCNVLGLPRKLPAPTQDICGVQQALALFDAAVEAELPCVSVVPYNSHEICKWFAKNVRERISKDATPATPSQPSQAPTTEESSAATITINLDEKLAALLRDTIGEDEDDGSASPVTLRIGDGTEGHGLYGWLTDYPEEGACFFAPVATPQPPVSGAGEGREDGALAAECRERAVDLRQTSSIGSGGVRKSAADLLDRCASALAAPQPAAAGSADPTEPGFDVEVLREHVRHLERHVRQLVAAAGPAEPTPQDAELASIIIPMPKSVAMAEAMQELGYAWLKQHAPERLKAAAGPAGGDERAAFEAWALSEDGGGWWPEALTRIGDCYKAVAVTKQWTGWQARARLSAVDDEVREREAGWQPIDTAPHDGLFDLWSEGKRHIDCYWDRICGEFRTITAGHLIILRKASHWRPVVAAPVQPKAEDV